MRKFFDDHENRILSTFSSLVGETAEEQQMEMPEDYILIKIGTRCRPFPECA